MNGMIFDIQSYSVHDGPGCRTNVFFVGCPLQCRWCANPESWKRKKHLMFSERSCKWDQGCRACANACPFSSLSFDGDGKPSVNWAICAECETIECATSCAANSLKQCVRFFTVDELVQVLLRDFANWGSDGGVTFSGGEPFLQHEYLLDVLKRCHKLGMHTAIETCAFTQQDIFLGVMQYIDFAFIDVKHMDGEKHKWGTGAGNERILGNISALAQSGWMGRLVLRQPTICGYNDSTENALKVIDFMNENSLYEINLLKFHRMGSTKWEQMGKSYEYFDHGDMSDDRMQELQQLYLDNDIACYIGEDTPF